MFSAIYIEREIVSHPRTIEITRRFNRTPQILIGRYGEVFNRKNQNFRLQKQLPSLILAKKHDNFVLKAPDNYGFYGKNNYYFSHMMNCIYDCRYCFLQGMYSSANYVLFINFEDFGYAIAKHINHHTNSKSYFNSGYDCDSLALEPITRFIDYIVPFFADKSNSMLELRTKSTQIRSLLDKTSHNNCVIAYSFTPRKISKALEHKVPNIDKRIDAIAKLQNAGWKIGIRFEPMIYEKNYKEHYRQLFDSIFSRLDVESLESVSLGLFRMPEKFYKKIVKLYPDEELFASPISMKNNQASYTTEIESEMLSTCKQLLLQFIPENIFYHCAN